MRVTDRIVDFLEDKGIDTVFGLPCEQMEPYYASLDDSNIRHILARNEATGAMMADGYARASFKPGICDGVSGPGAINITSGLVEANGASSPVLALTGDNPHAFRGLEGIQDGDNCAIMSEVVKESYDPENPDKAAYLIANAYKVAISGVPSPVHFNLPENIMKGETDKSVGQSIPSSYPASRPRPDKNQLKKAVSLLEDADKPVIFSGEGSIRSQAWDQVTKLAERTNIPVATSINGKGIVDETSPVSAGVSGRWGYCDTANEILQEADCILAIGCQLGWLSTNIWTTINDNADLIHVDLDEEWLGKNYEPAVPIQADIKATVSDILDEIDTSIADDNKSRLNAVQESKEEFFETHAFKLQSDDTPIQPQRIVHELNNRTEPDTIVVSATSFPGFFTGAFYKVRKPGVGYIQARGSDGINYCLPQALGVQAARPDTPVVAVSGDGAIGYHISELETASRENLPITLIIFNNKSFRSSKLSQQTSYEVDISTDFNPDVDFAKVAEGFGCDGKVVEGVEDFINSFESALDSNNPTVLDVQVDPDAIPPVQV